MNKIIKGQLEKCKVANIPDFDDNTTEMLITKGSTLRVTPYQVDKCFIVEFADYILNPPPNFTLAENWNRGTKPSHKFYKAEIQQVMGKMVKVMGCGYDPTTNTDYIDIWEGWVPQEGITLHNELK